MSESFHFLVIGSGSVGKRHAQNLAAMGCRISCMDPRADRISELQEEVDTIGAFFSVGDALTAFEYDGAIICSPPNAHASQTIVCLEAGIPVLLEKPVSPELADAQRLSAAQIKTGVSVLLGYTWRWWPPLQRTREMLLKNEIGVLRHVRFVMSAHLADWHPWEPYQDFFMSKKEQGGGALLDESHWIDLCLWLFGLPEKVFASVEKVSNLEINSDDNVDMVLTYPDGLRVTLHLDLFGRPHEKSIVFVGENGTIHWTADPNQVVVGRGIDEWRAPETFECQRNDMFEAVAKEFIDMVNGHSVTCTLDDGIDVLRVIEAARASSQNGQAVYMSDTAQ